MQTVDFIIKVAAVVTALGAIGAFAWKIINWFLSQHKQTTDIEDLKELHTKDMEELRQNETEELQAVKDELCVISFALLAALDGLKQLGANGNVTKAHNELEKHLNKQAHGQ